MLGAVLVFAAQLSQEITASKRVIGLFRDACVRGQFSLTKAHGVKIEYAELPTAVGDDIRFRGLLDSPSVIKITDPADTYLVFGSIHNSGTGRVRCVVYSKSIELQDGLNELTQDGRVTPVQQWVPNASLYRWTKTDRKLGYSKVFDLMLPGWSRIEVKHLTAKQ